MPNIEQLGEAARNPQLLSRFSTTIRLGVFMIISANPRDAALLTWAKRARFTYGDDRTQHYATLALEWAVQENALLRAAIELDPANPQITDADILAIVSAQVAIFAELEI